MRHLKDRRKLNRNATHRRALMRNLTRALVHHERIITTVAKARETRRFVEKLITLAKRGSLNARRLAISRLGGDLETVRKIFADLAPRYADRPGGYTRIIKRAERRLGDGGVTAYLELVKAGETRVRERRAPAPAPRIETPATETPAAESSAAESPAAEGQPEKKPEGE